MLWNEQGIYLGFRLEDADIQGNKTRTNDWLWLEDVAEIFIAPASDSGLHYEIQVNPAGTQYANMQSGTGTVPATALDDFKRRAGAFVAATHVDGTINDSAQPDREWTMELYLPWSLLREIGATAGKMPQPGDEPFCVRFSSWDLTVYTHWRLYRLSAPGPWNPHQTRFYRPIRLLK